MSKSLSFNHRLFGVLVQGEPPCVGKSIWHDFRLFLDNEPLDFKQIYDECPFFGHTETTMCIDCIHLSRGIGYCGMHSAIRMYY